ncbi:MAG: aminotransferase class III-fold pyridoxal phosphate-dependent enzyme, partial [Ignavibacteriae bacterium]|nr:aminotransferase class III-fold pyridoxal phosphate-dependent enzyme [Ignavibacteriota bacterium]
SIRNLGLMIGIELKDKVQPYIVELMEKGILAMPAGTTILRLLPPVVIPYADLDKVADVINEMLK